MTNNLTRFAKRKRFSRRDVLEIMEALSVKVGIESFGRVLDAKQELGFGRYDSSETLTNRTQSDTIPA